MFKVKWYVIVRSMETELEAKFLNINPASLRLKLEQNGAALVHGECLMRRKIFDYSDLRLEKEGGWVRVRDEGDKITLSFKQVADRSVSGTKEVSVVVDNFNTACGFLEAIGLKSKSQQETKREKWGLNGVEITIDIWPWIPPLIEIEGTSEEQIKQISSRLDLDWSKALHGSIENAYQAYYNVTEKEIDDMAEIAFVDVPVWLESRRYDKLR